MTMQPTDREKQLSDLMLASGKRAGKLFEAGKQAGRQELINGGLPRNKRFGNR